MACEYLDERCDSVVCFCEEVKCINCGEQAEGAYVSPSTGVAFPKCGRHLEESYVIEREVRHLYLA